MGRSAGGRFLNSWFVNWVTLVIVGGVALGSLLPLNFTWDAGSRFGLDRIGWRPSPARDVITNLAVYVPVGAIFAFLLRRHTSNIVIGTCVAAFAAGVCSTGLEWGQTFLPMRVASWVDVWVNVFGAILGAGTVNTIGLARPLKRRLANAARYRPLSLAAKAATVGIIAYHLMPFDFVTSTDALRDSLRQARLQPTTYHAGAETWLSWIGLAGQFALLGALSLVSFSERRWQPARAAWDTVWHLTVIALTLEVSQIFVASHAFDIMDAFSAIFGGVAGVLTMRIVLPIRRRGLGLVLGGVLLIQIIYLLLSHAAPFKWLRDSQPWSQAVAIPFWSYFIRPFGSACADLAGVAGAYGFLALTLLLLLSSAPRSLRIVVSLAVVPSIALIAEGLQLFVAGRQADITEPFVAVLVTLTLLTLDPTILSRFGKSAFARRSTLLD